MEETVETNGKMIYVEADNILSPLGMTTEQNAGSIVAGRSALQSYTDSRGLMEPYTAALITEEQWDAIADGGLSRFERMVICSARRALQQTTIDVSSPRTVLIIGSTKSSVEQLQASAACSDTSGNSSDASSLYPGQCARRIAEALGVTTMPVTVCNACISGLSAVILAQRLLEAGLYDHAIVCGADRQSEFIISGFQSLKALSPTECRPFDMERTGLNLGEAAATILLSRHQTRPGQWTIVRGSIHNDAYHVTQPAKRGDGLTMCLEDIIEKREVGTETLALVNAHGTATLFNDQMESVAIERAGLADVPVNALKGYFGHTLGAAGILETIITMHTLDQHIIIGTRGYEERGVSGKVSLSAENQTTDKTSFIKTVSGFGGCNAAVLVERGEGFGGETFRGERREESRERNGSRYETLGHVRITPHEVSCNGKQLATDAEGLALLTSLYKHTGGNYPKFYKMDALSRLGYVAAELLLAEAGQQDPRCAVILFNRSSSVDSDRKYLASIADDSYYPSPSVFIYTLPNIVTGEMAIRHGLHGETSLYILPQRNEALQQQIVSATLANTATPAVITGWLDYEDESHFEADIRLIKKK